ncbi:hypothetical protein GCM10023206_12330 [Acinetobacter puyangensis]|uniref:Immunity protein 26 n=1 Tax=Acinetobacter puyangensis TaxID=1096779 RepID=A0A240E9S2_9GAMM|nr:immunity 26/phosphotriesterase HocA family protein [Acinetobacter puyangensis]SNX45454.1 Immunity protein 26 [Acinetobacter puyangensis]
MVDNKRKRRRVKVGDIFGIDLGDSKYCYCIVLDSPLVGFYDLQVNDLKQDVKFITSHKILFKVWLMKYAFKSEKWHFIGNIELSEELNKRVYFFKQDQFDYSISIYYSEGNESIEIPATYDDVKGLERAAVWDPEHVEDRLRDHFNGVPNVWVEQLKPKPIVS